MKKIVLTIVLLSGVVPMTAMEKGTDEGGKYVNMGKFLSQVDLDLEKLKDSYLKKDNRDSIKVQLIVEWYHSFTDTDALEKCCITFADYKKHYSPIFKSVKNVDRTKTMPRFEDIGFEQQSRPQNLTDLSVLKFPDITFLVQSDKGSSEDESESSGTYHTPEETPSDSEEGENLMNEESKKSENKRDTKEKIAFIANISKKSVDNFFENVGTLDEIASIKNKPKKKGMPYWTKAVMGGGVVVVLFVISYKVYEFLKTKRGHPDTEMQAS